MMFEFVFGRWCLVCLVCQVCVWCVRCVCFVCLVSLLQLTGISHRTALNSGLCAWDECRNVPLNNLQSL